MNRAEICNDCKHGGYGVADQECGIGKDNTNPDCPEFKRAAPFRCFVIQKGEEKYSDKPTFEEAKDWIGYMVYAHDAKPIRIENLETGEVMTNNLFNRW